MPKTNSICKLCHSKFYAKPSHIKRGFGIYCSSICQYKGARKGKMVNCAICGKKSYKQKKALDRSKSGKFFCGKSCQTKWRNAFFIQEKHANWKDGRYAYKSVLTRHDIPQTCKLCDTEDARVLAVHHIDRNRKNNKVDNLAWLCHNCHHLVHRYKLERDKFMAVLV